jgi:hypothetical protein
VTTVGEWGSPIPSSVRLTEQQPGERSRAAAESAALDTALFDLMFFTGLQGSATITEDKGDF